MEPQRYRGRFAPSPTGPLHAGSLVAAMASWLDARAVRGQWLLRIEDLDTARNVPGAEHDIVQCLAGLGFRWEQPYTRQSERQDYYEASLTQLVASRLAYPCACSRREIGDAGLPGTDGAPVYPGTCRGGLHGRPARSWRVMIDQGELAFTDRASGPVMQDVTKEVGDFVLKRADGPYAYQLAVVVDDAAQGITHVVRGTDLLDSTPRQIVLQRMLGLVTPSYLHVPTVLAEDGQKLSKQTGAQAVSWHEPLVALRSAAKFLGLGEFACDSLDDFWAEATRRWSSRWNLRWNSSRNSHRSATSDTSGLVSCDGLSPDHI
jgi:glutamyl-Q tRNA(Asp) synthetase